MRVIILIGTFIAIAIAILVFAQDLENNIKHYPNVLNLLVAVGTIAATLLALYFGLYGSYETKISLQGNENKLDREAFIFLTHIHQCLPIDNTISPRDKFKFINDFEDKIINNAHLISGEKQKKLRQYAQLAKDYNDPNNNTKGKTFSTIIEQARYLQNNTLFDTDRIQEILEHEDRLYCKNNIYIITPIHPQKSKPQVLIYYDHDSTRSADMKIRNSIQEFLKKENKISSVDNDYIEENMSDCKRFNRNEYLFDYMDRSELEIRILIQGKVITLTLKKPYLVEDNGLTRIKTRSQSEHGL